MTVRTATEVSLGRSWSLISLAAQGALIAGFAAFLVAALHPDLRSQVRSTIVKDTRTVVSTARGDLLGNGAALTVAKIRTGDILLLEIYETVADGTQQLIERIELPDKKDGYFNFNGQATNLAIDDVDGDGKAEILAPSFDQNLTGHLNIYRYNQGEKSFQRVLR